MSFLIDIQNTKELDSLLIIKKIKNKILIMLKIDPKGFYNFLYRFDFSQELAMELIEKDQIDKLATKIWERQLKKMENWD